MNWQLNKSLGKPIFSSSKEKNSKFFPAILLEIIIITVFISWKFLLDENLGNVNEIDVLPLAKQFVLPNWIPQDWYLNQPPGYRFLFQTIFGNLISILGFLPASIIGRLFCYFLFATGLVLISQKIQLNILGILLSLILFFNLRAEQGAIAYEWLIGGLETKSVAYGFVLLAISFLLSNRYFLMMGFLGLATSFHVLVGGWSFLTTLTWLILRRKNIVNNWNNLLWILFAYFLGSIWAIKPVLEQLFTREPNFPISSSYIYVFLRLPHHLNPLSWRIDSWIIFMVYLVCLGISIYLISHNKTEDLIIKEKKIDLAIFTLLSLIPFVAGLLIAPWDTQGKFLQYYPFRLGDILLPLHTNLLFVSVCQKIFIVRHKKNFLSLSLLVIIFFSVINFNKFCNNLVALHQFPSAQQDVNANWKDLSIWIREHTPQNSIFISSPIDFTNFTWLTERGTIAKYKLLPQSKAGIIAWYERLQDLSGNSKIWSKPTQNNYRKKQIIQDLIQGYNNLNTFQVENLMTKYHANYFLTFKNHKLNFSIAYQNSDYILYQKKSNKQS